jgi:hypothetical protein
MIMGITNAPHTNPDLRFIAFNMGGTAKLGGARGVSICLQGGRHDQRTWLTFQEQLPRIDQQHRFSLFKISVLVHELSTEDLHLI